MNNTVPTTPPFRHGDWVRVIADDVSALVVEIDGADIIAQIDEGIGLKFRADELEFQARAVLTTVETSTVKVTSADRCAPWCDRKAEHAADPKADDGDCWGRDFSTALNSEGWVMGFPLIADVCAFREANAEDSVVMLTVRSSGYYDGRGYKLAPTEARRIAAHLLRVAEAIEGQAR